MRTLAAVLFIEMIILFPRPLLALPPPSPTISNVPDAICLSPGSGYPSNSIGVFTVQVNDFTGPVEGSFVEVEISPDADVLVGWCQSGSWGGAQVHPILTGFTDTNGNVTFEFHGGGCLSHGRFSGATYIAQVRADGLVLDEPYINSPDAVNFKGLIATDEPPTGGMRRCDMGPEVVPISAVTLSDAVFHTPSIKLGLKEPCTKFTPPFDGPAQVQDAVFLTPYIKNGNVCKCQ